MAHAMFLNQAAISVFESLCGDETVDFDIVLVVAFLWLLSPTRTVLPLGYWLGLSWQDWRPGC